MFRSPSAAGRAAVFYLDSGGLNVMEQLRWVPGAPTGQNYEIIRELKARAA